MTTRMEKIAEDVALAVLRDTGPSANPPLQPEILAQAFQAGWPTPESRSPMNDAMTAAAQAAISCTGLNAGRWKDTIYQAWQPAVQETVDGYFKDARHSFEQGQYLKGAEILADAVRATLGHIASVRNWPHGAHGDLYSIVAALGSGSRWPETQEEFDQALDNCSKEGQRLASALGASTGLPDSIKFGTYADNPEHVEENGLSFAETVIELANRLAEKVPGRP
jgi:hypothetical protein